LCLCGQYCFEASNVIFDALSRAGLNGYVDFKYLPLNHVNASTGAFLCDGMDCPATRFDSCLVREYCWFQEKDKP